jgi:ornithine cyclodeaminase/alanine dehydrogenase-like protein (mu-crystallin family)
MLYLSEERVGELLRWGELIDAMETTLAGFSLGRVLQPVRNMLTIEEGKRYLGIMPAVAREAMGAKLVSFYPGNAGTNAPTHMAMILLFQPDTGEPLAVMDGRLITEMRTAAVSAAATRRLAAPDSRILALLGSGVQADAHLRALRQVRPFEDIRVWSRTPEHAVRFAERHNAKAVSAEAAVSGADVVVTATNALEPILKGGWLKPGAHVNAVGSPRPTWRELDDDAMANVVIVDSREAVLVESGDVILSGATIYAEIGEIFAGIKPAPVATTIFKSVGIAIEDIASAKLVFDAASRSPEASDPAGLRRLDATGSAKNNASPTADHSAM